MKRNDSQLLEVQMPLLVGGLRGDREPVPATGYQASTWGGDAGRTSPSSPRWGIGLRKEGFG